MTTTHLTGKTLLDTIVQASHEQRCRALTTVLDSLIDLGVTSRAAPTAAAFEATARTLGLVVTNLESHEQPAAVTPTDPIDLLVEATSFLRQLRVGMLDGSDPWRGALIAKLLKQQLALHIAEGTYTQVREVATDLLMGLGGLPQLRRPSIAELYQATAVSVVKNMQISLVTEPCMRLMTDCREYLQDVNEEALNPDKLDGLVAEIDSYVKSATLTPQAYAKRWANAVALLTPPLTELEAVSLEMKGQQLNLQFMPDRDLAALAIQFGTVDPATGHCADTIGAQACLVERAMRAADAPRGWAQRLGSAPPAAVINDIEPTWHLFKVEACGGDESSGDLYAYLLVSALSASALKAEELARQAVDEALPESYAVTDSQYLCPCDRDIFNLVQSDELLPGFDTEREQRAERPRA